ncbi:hypothetical protein J437_LFUL017381 [Ladona fulva]|uniref:Adenylosuccinate synthetase n=1 Tax=Ladona fulva TaxID=123851 RepID=A0A8K0KLJ0_LADFU|nr:hypothetical protein J437_LFUL017381 [Ladona fulva]
MASMLYLTNIVTGSFINDEIGSTLQTRGSEFGVTTKRMRRCGWLDIPVLQYTTKVNGYSGIALTKLDILDTLKEIKIGVAYKENGKILKDFPANSSKLAAVEVEYITLPGWQTNIEGIREYNELPKEAKDYVERIEEYLEVPVRWIGVGKGRESMIEKTSH